MMKRKAEKMLEVAADMQRFSNHGDRLEDMINHASNGELSEFELELVTAAAAAPKLSFEDFLKKANNKKIGK